MYRVDHYCYEIPALNFRSHIACLCERTGGPGGRRRDARVDWAFPAGPGATGRRPGVRSSAGSGGGAHLPGPTAANGRFPIRGVAVPSAMLPLPEAGLPGRLGDHRAVQTASVFEQTP